MKPFFTMKIKSGFKAILILMFAFSLNSRATGVSDFLTDIDSMDNYFLQLRLDTSLNTSRILFQKCTIKIDKEISGNDYRQHITHKFEKLILLNNNEDIEKLISLSLPYTSNLKVRDIEAVIYNRTNGKLTATNLKKSDLLKEKLAEHVKIIKLNFPNIKKGSVIYYTFTYKYEVPDGSRGSQYYVPVTWAFQNDCYTDDSYFDITLDNDLVYDEYGQNVVFQQCATFDKLVQSSSGIWTEQQKKTTQIVFHRKNIEAMKEEPFMGNSDKFQEKITFRLDLLKHLPTLPTRRPTSWQNANDEYLFGSPYLGYPVFKPNDTLSFVLNKIGENKTDNLKFAKAIYTYVRDSIECRGNSEVARIWASTSTKNIINSKKGYTADKNILLSALLRKAGFKSYPVVMSTQDDIELSDKFVDLDLLNYTISYVEIDNKAFFLDASSRYLPFGILKPICYNEFAWLVDEKGSLLTMKSNDLVDKSTFMATLKPTAKKGTYDLKVQRRFGNVSAPLFRELWQSDSAETKKMLEKSIEQLRYKIKIKDQQIENIYKADTSLTVNSNLELELNESGDYIYINPFFKPFIENNPFKDLNRKYPVRFTNAQECWFILTFNLPEGYSPEEADENINFNFKNEAMNYKRVTQYDSIQNIIYIKSFFKVNTTKIPIEDYKELRSFYEDVINDQQKSLVLKKNK
jgi:hypothetical protein